MPYCSILQCKNDSRTKNITYGGISYHRFPKDPCQKEKWIDATGRQNWMPAKTSTICSVHFNQNDIVITAKGYRYLNSTAVPTQNTVTVMNQTNADTEMRLPGPSKKWDLCTIDDENTFIANEKLRQNPFKKQHTSSRKSRLAPIIVLGSTYTSLRIQRLNGMLRWAQNKIKNQKLKIKRLQTQSRRFKRKLVSVENNLKELKDKFAMTNENLASLQHLNV